MNDTTIMTDKAIENENMKNNSNNNNNNNNSHEFKISEIGIAQMKPPLSVMKAISSNNSRNPSLSPHGSVTPHSNVSNKQFPQTTNVINNNNNGNLNENNNNFGNTDSVLHMAQLQAQRDQQIRDLQGRIRRLQELLMRSQNEQVIIAPSF